MIGLRLLEAIGYDNILARVDPDDDGISGRVNRVWNQALERMAMVRLGWKAGKATIATRRGEAEEWREAVCALLAGDPTAFFTFPRSP